MAWAFYGRSAELKKISNILNRGAFFFCQISGRRRIGKTTLLKEALDQAKSSRRFYVQIPDSDARGVAGAFENALKIWSNDSELAHALSDDFQNIAATLSALWYGGYKTALDEFQYFHRKELNPFMSHLQTEIDHTQEMSKANQYKQGGLFVLGSVHTQMQALLHDNQAPLFGRRTDIIDLQHWDFETLFEMFQAHNITNPYQRLFLWSLFEGVPKFYQDCYNQDIFKLELKEPNLFDAHREWREETLRRLFFESSAPLAGEAESWFLHELRGKYVTILQIIAHHGACDNARLKNGYSDRGVNQNVKQFGGYLKTLTDGYRMVENNLPFGTLPQSRKTRYVIADNFLAAWLSSIHQYVEAARMQPIESQLTKTSDNLKTHEGRMFEKLCRQVLQEASRKKVGFLPITNIGAYWNRGGDLEIDIIAINEDEKRIHFGECKRNAESHKSNLREFRAKCARFLETAEGRPYADWPQEYGLYAPEFTQDMRSYLENLGYKCVDMNDMENWLYPRGTGEENG